MTEPSPSRFRPCAQARIRGLRARSVAAAAALALGCADEAAEEEPERAVTATWVEASQEEIREVRETVGSLEALARPLRASEIGGTVSAIHVDEGDAVERGELLAEIEREDYIDDRDAAAAEVARLTALVGVQERNVRRARELHADDHISEDELDNTEAELEAQEEQLNAALAQLRRAERDLERTRIRAGIDGRVDERRVSEGDYVTSGEAVFELLDPERLRVRLPVSETLAPRLDPGTELVVRSRSGAAEPVSASVGELRPGIREGTRTVHLIAEVTNPGGWRPGASAEAEVVLDEREGVVVPAQGVVRRPAGHTVYVLEEGAERVEARTVTVGTRFGDRAEIAEGLEAGERIIVDGSGFLTDGALVDATPLEGDDADTE